MICPCCGAAIESSQERYQARMRALGRCTTCGSPVDGDHYQCRPCRIKRSERQRQRYLQKTRADIPEQRT